jgi:hypothetical protein
MKPRAKARASCFFDYEFKSRTLGALMGSMFDAAFRKFPGTFERRADTVYGRRLKAIRKRAQQRAQIIASERARGSNCWVHP